MWSQNKNTANEINMKDYRLLEEMMAASFGMSVVSAVLNPLDVIKVRMQQKCAPAPDIVGCARWSIEKGGGFIRGLLLPGLAATCLRDILNGAFRVGSFKEVERRLFETHTDVPVVVRKMVTGCIVGSIGAGAWSHTDLVKTRMQCQPVSTPLVYSSTLDCYRQIYTREGFRSLFHGVVPNMVRASIITTFHVGTYDFAKQVLLRNQLAEDTFMTWTVCGFASALVTTTVAAPVDMVRTRMMLSKSESALRVAKQIYRSSGVNGFCIGWFPSFLRFGPHFSMSWPLIELVRTRLFGLASF